MVNHSISLLNRNYTGWNLNKKVKNQGIKLILMITFVRLLISPKRKKEVEKRKKLSVRILIKFCFNNKIFKKKSSYSRNKQSKLCKMRKKQLKVMKLKKHRNNSKNNWTKALLLYRKCYLLMVRRSSQLPKFNNDISVLNKCLRR